MARMTISLLVGVLVCSIAMTAVAPAAFASGPQANAGPAKAVPITLYGRISSPGGWGLGPNNVTQPGPAITVDPGDVITFTLFAGDGQVHNLVIDLNSNNVQDTSEPHSANFNSSTSAITFVYTAGTAGSLQYICGFHTGNAMRGVLTVRSTTSPAPASDNTLLVVGGVIGVVVIVGVAAAAMRMRKKKPGP